MSEITGRVFRFGDHINTDTIIPTQYLSGDREKMGQYCMHHLDPTFASRAKEGGIVVGGVNFGCGSTKPASLALLGAGVRCVVARSFSRIFFRNAINAGLLVVTCPEAVDLLNEGDMASVDVAGGVVRDLTTGAQATFAAYPPVVSCVIAAGGLTEAVRTGAIQRLMGEETAPLSGEETAP